MIALIIIGFGVFLSVIFNNQNIMLATLMIALVVVALKQMFHGYEIQKMKERIYGKS